MSLVAILHNCVRGDVLSHTCEAKSLLLKLGRGVRVVRQLRPKAQISFLCNGHQQLMLLSWKCNELLVAIAEEDGSCCERTQM